MKALRCNHYGSPMDLVVEEVAPPVPGPGEVLIDVAAAAINYPDVLIVQNKYQVSIPVPFTPGSEFAGRVREIGSEVRTLAVGDLVMGAGFDGAFADIVAVPATAVSRVPTGMDVESAASGTVALRTAYHALTTIGETKNGDTVVVLGASGGVGSASIQIASRLGARVVAGVSTDERAQWCLDAGADHAVVYTRESLKDRLKELTGGVGADVVVDPVGGQWSEQALRATAWGGRFVVVGFADGDIPRIPLNLLLLKGVVLRGFEIRTIGDHLPERVAAGDARLHEMIADGLRPSVTEVVSLNEVPDALERVRTRRVIGKVVVRMGDAASRA